MTEKNNGPTYAETKAALLKHLSEQQSKAPAEPKEPPPVSLSDLNEANRKRMAKFLGIEPEGEA